MQNTEKYFFLVQNNISKSTGGEKVISIETKIEEVVKMDNNIINFFNKEKIDFCCSLK